MKLLCLKCGDFKDVYVELSGPHLKASCGCCGKYIKFLSSVEKKQLEEEEDKLAYNHPQQHRDGGI